eukprot:scaffold1014_cov274-Chaetoceros_neogracile.AAC.15
MNSAASGEPMFAPKKSENASEDEDDGHIISVIVMNNGKEKSSEIMILDATKITAGPIARVPLGIAIPHALHGCFASLTSAIDLLKKSKEYQSFEKGWNQGETRGMKSRAISLVSVCDLMILKCSSEIFCK